MGVWNGRIGMSEKTFKIVGNDMSDGYHTFDELYEHRCLLFLNICMDKPEKCVFKKDYETWFCLYYESPFGQISYHLPDKYLEVVRAQIRQDDNYEFDGHSSKEVIGRLTSTARFKSGK